MKTALVLEGGAMRGIYTAGVLDILLENDIKVDGVIGVSAGSIHGCNFVSKQKERSIKYYKACRNDYRFLSFKSFLKTGNIVDTEYCYHEIPDKKFVFDHNTFNKSKTKFYVTVTNVETGKAEYIHCTDLKKQIDYLRASASMQVVSQIVEINGNKYLDGGIADSIPIEKFQEMGYDKCIVVQTRPEGYKKGKDKMYMIEKRLYKNYPNLLKSMKNRHVNYNKTLEKIDELEKNKEIIRIRPSKKIKIGRLEKNMKTIVEMYELGRHDAKDKIKDIKKFLKEK